MPMPPAATLKGTVRDRSGRPVAGALVTTPGSVGLFVEPSEVEDQTRTDANGHFVLRDLHKFKYVPRNLGGRPLWMTSRPPYLTIVHPDYVQTDARYTEVPGEVDVTLSDGRTIRFHAPCAATWRRLRDVLPLLRREP